MIDYNKVFETIQETVSIGQLYDVFKKANDSILNNNNGHLIKWLEVYGSLPFIKPSVVDLNSEYVKVGEINDCTDGERDFLKQLLKSLHPWRKGPYNILGIKLEAEWRSDMKWHRLKDHIDALQDKAVLDVGSGNGYYCLRMIGAGAKLAIGIDFTLLYVLQFLAIQKYINDPRVSVLPLSTDDIPDGLGFFDTVFSMGVIYHRKDPLAHLTSLKSFLKSGGELVVEALIIDGRKGDVLKPSGRYAKMRNVYFIPSVLTLEDWLKRQGFKNIRLIDVNLTTSKEQRATDWMEYQSLDDFLDPKDKNFTIEGYTAPQRAIFLANKP